MDEVTFAREVIAIHPRALVAWANDVGPIPTGETVKVVRYPDAASGAGILGHVQALPADGTPGVVFKAEIDEHGALRWRDVSKPTEIKAAIVTYRAPRETRGSGGSDIAPKQTKSITFKTTVEIVQLPRMIGYREKQAEQAKARELAVAEIAAQKAAQEAARIAALADKLALVAARVGSRTAQEDYDVRAARIWRKHDLALERLVQRAAGEQRRRRTNEAMRRYGLPPVARWRV